MKRRILRGGIVGCGGVASIAHIPAFKALKDVGIVAVCDLQEDVAREAARRFGINGVYGDIIRMLEKEELDFVDICSPPATHCQLSLQAMEAGIHVLVEKPMAVSLSEADEMTDASLRNKVKLCVVHNLLFTPVVQKAKDMVDSGDIGDLISVEVTILVPKDGAKSRESHWSNSLPGGILGEFSPHAIYLVSAFLGKINSIQAIATKQSHFPWVTADELRVIVDAENGLGGFTISCNSPIPAHTMDIFGTGRNLHLNNFTMSMIRHKPATYGILGLVYDDIKSGFQLFTGNANRLIKAVFGQRWYGVGHRVLISSFLDSIRDDTEPPVTGEDGRETLKIMEEILRQVNIYDPATFRERVEL